MHGIMGKFHYSSLDANYLLYENGPCKLANLWKSWCFYAAYVPDRLTGFPATVVDSGYHLHHMVPLPLSCVEPHCSDDLLPPPFLSKKVTFVFGVGSALLWCCPRELLAVHRSSCFSSLTVMTMPGTGCCWLTPCHDKERAHLHGVRRRCLAVADGALDE